ncbi:MAG: DUF4115 domain-containing protein [Azoarcus sp.]|jgi:cytoskeleton protein RodZ|nr:DUF4115 domain-containing protein [Azoarcus sp.]
METDPVMADGKPAAEENAAPESESATSSAFGEAPALMPGEILRKAREARGESLGDVVQVLKLSLQQLEALENDRFDILPGPTFVRGFLRNYARHLGLDPEPLLASLDSRVAKTRTVDLTMVSNAGGDVPVGLPGSVKSQSSSGMLLVLLFVLTLVIAAAIAFSQGWIDLPPMPLGKSPVPASTAVAPAPEPAPSAKERVVVLALPAPVAAVDEQPGEPSAEAVASAPADTVLPDAGVAIAPEAGPAAADVAPVSAPVSAPAPAPVPVSASAISTLRFTFLANAWVQVREGPEGSGKMLFVGTGNAGSSRNVRGMPPFSLVVAKANKVTLEFNGAPIDLRQYVGKDGIARLILR